ncbi:MAG: tRNA guanosine(34) transglycosylase Tgt [Chloroflexi bacterium]|nr:tRNA guanosine(34) transglycosylase Tgt [Chloroflexota bacterium]
MPQPLRFQVLAHDPSSSARVGRVETPHGAFATPAFVPVATRAAVRALAASDLRTLDAEVVLCNTYHLFLRPGAETIAALGGLHGFMGWAAPIITDSGGYQVFSLGAGQEADELKGRRRGPAQPSLVRITEEGVEFRSPLDGARHFFTPEQAIAVQHQLGADILLAFDECTAYHHDYAYTRASVQRTHRWAERCLAYHRASPHAERQALFGIVQGGVHRDLREQSAAFIGGLPFDGLAIGGSLGRTKQEWFQVVEWVIPQLPAERPRHLLGVGDVDDLVEGIARGVDWFDCALPTRLARHGTLLGPWPAERWRLHLTRGEFARDASPVDPTCDCLTCREHTRAYLHYLLRSGEATGWRLATIHNLAFLLRLMRAARECIVAGRFAAWRAAVLGVG